MVDVLGKIKWYFRVTKIDKDNNLEIRDRVLLSLLSAKWEQLISFSINICLDQRITFSTKFSNNILEENNQEYQVFQNFLFDLVNNANDAIPSNPEILPLSFFCTISEISNRASKSPNSGISFGGLVIWSEMISNTKLLRLLAITHRSENFKPKNYK